MARFKFSRDYNHRWPSRAMSQFRANGGPESDGTYTVKREVAETAEPLGYGTWLDKPDTTLADGAKRQPADDVDERNHAPHGNHAPGNELEPVRRTRGRPKVSVVPSAG
jgi:hypothetical protein